MQRTLVISGREFSIAALGSPIDQAFDQLHAAYLGNATLAWDKFTTAALRYFDDNPTVATAHDSYFSNFTIIWQSLIAAGRLHEAEHVWELALQPAQHWEQSHPGRRLHKGTPYYFWAMTALLRGDTDHGYLLIHQSLDEDIRTSRQQMPKTPGFALVSLNFEEVNQAFRQWVLQQAEFLNDLIANYSNTYQRVLTIKDVRRRFFEAPPTLDAIFLLTYTIARLRKITILPDYAVNNAFAGQLQINLLFDVTLVIDAAIRAKNPKQWKFIHHAEELLKAAGHPLTYQQLTEINGQFESSFDAALRGALTGTLIVQQNIALDRLQCDVALAYGLRNYGAHRVSSTPTMWQDFSSVQQALFRVLWATIDYLY